MTEKKFRMLKSWVYSLRQRWQIDSKVFNRYLLKITDMYYYNSAEWTTLLKSKLK